MATIDGIKRVRVVRKKTTRPKIKKKLKISRPKIPKSWPTTKANEENYQQQLKSLRIKRDEKKPTEKRQIFSEIKLVSIKNLGIVFFILAIVVVFTLWGFSIKQNFQRVKDAPQDEDSTWQETKAGLNEIIIDFQNTVDNLQNFLDQQKNVNLDLNANSQTNSNQSINGNLSLTPAQKAALEQKLYEQLQQQSNSNQNNNLNQ